MTPDDRRAELLELVEQKCEHDRMEQHMVRQREHLCAPDTAIGFKIVDRFIEFVF